MVESNIIPLSIIAMMLLVLRISLSSCQIANNELPSTDLYRAYLNDVLGPSKQVKRSDNFRPLDNIQNGNSTSESTYERVIRNLRTNWEMPVNYLQQRGYLTKPDSKLGYSSNDLSMDAYNLINGPLLNPTTFKNVYPIPHGPYSLQSVNSERNAEMIQEHENDGGNGETEKRSYSEASTNDCRNPSMMNNLACLEQYLGENWMKSAKDKWNSWLHKNQSTTTPPTTTTVTTTTPTTAITTTSTTSSPISQSTNSTNGTSEVLTDLSIQDAQDGLEFFKMYNDFMLAKLASKLSQNVPERRMLNSVQNPESNLPEVVQTPTPQVPLVPDFSRINENDIKILKDLDNCLKNKKTRSKIEGNPSHIIKSDVTDDRRVTNSYLPTKLKFLAHIHHEVYDIGNVKPLSKDHSTISENLNGNDCNVDVTNFGISNSTYSFSVK